MSLFEFSPVGLCKLSHTVEGEINCRHFARVHGGTKAFLIMPSVDPAVRKTMPVGGLMIVEHALSDMQDFFLGNIAVCQRLQHVVKVAVIRFITANIFCSHHGIKGNPKARTGA